MDIAYADYIISKFSNFLDPFSLNDLSTERLCYPISYASEEVLKGLQGISKGKDAEDDILLQQSLKKDLPDFENPFTYPTITDGAAYIIKNYSKEPLIQLVGMPITGKSSLLRKIALLAAQSFKSGRSSHLPLLVNSEIFIQQQVSSKMELIESCFSQYEEFEAFLREKFFEGQVILLLDELEKAGTLKNKVIQWLVALKTFVKVPLCVIASRYSGYIEVPQVPVLFLEIYPMKLQISMAQSMLSELQFERFVETTTCGSSFFSEFASTPYLFSLLLEMFRWGIVGTEENFSRGRLYLLSIKHLLAEFDTPQYWNALELLASDILIRDSKVFNLYELKNLEIEETWKDIKDLDLFIVQENNEKTFTPRSSEIDEDSFDIGIGEIRDTIIMKSFSIKDNTPKWVANSRDNYINYQIARTYIENDLFNTGDHESFRFLHLRLVEVLAAQYFLNQIEDSLLHTTSGFLMESSAFQRAFLNCFPHNFLFSRRYREVLLFFAGICSENIFENLIKYLLHKDALEYCYLAGKLLVERGFQPNHRPLINKFKQDKQELVKKNFLKGFCHPSSAVRSLCKAEALEAGFTESDLSMLINKNISSLLKNTHWLYLKHLVQFNKETNSYIIRAVFLRLLEVSLQILQNRPRPANNKVILHKVLASMFLSIFDKADLHALDLSFHSLSQSPVCEKVSEEATIRISFDKLKIPRNELALIEKLGNTQKITIATEELIQNSPGVDVVTSVRFLLLFGCSISRIHYALALRFEKFSEVFEKIGVLKALRMLGFVTQHTIDIPLLCLNDAGEVKLLAKEILQLLNIEKLKKHALALLMKDDSSAAKLLLALKALKFIRKTEVDEETVYILAQFIDHYCLELRFEAISSLYAILKTSKPIEHPGIRKILAAAPHVLKDRLCLLKYDPTLRIISAKCLTMLWVTLDKGRKETNCTSMHHILVKDHRSSSFIVGNATSVISILKDFFNRTQAEKEAAWICLKKIGQVFEEIEPIDAKFFIEEMKKVLGSQSAKEVQNVLDLLETAPITSEEQAEFALILLKPEIVFHPSHVDSICKLFSTWEVVDLLKHLDPSADQSGVLQKLNFLITGLEKCVLYNSESSISDYKSLVNWYKSLINQVAENMQWPSKLYPHCNQLLDISADPSFFVREESELSAADECLVPKVSLDSANSDPDEDPPDLNLIFELIKSGVRSDGLKYWVLWHLRNPSDIGEFLIAAESWKTISDLKKDFYNPQVENSLLKFINEHPDDIVNIVIDLKFKSDSFCLKILECMVKGLLKLENSCKALISCMELNTPTLLEEVYKLLWINSGDTSQLVFLSSSTAKVLKSIRILNDVQLTSVVKALNSTECSLLVQPLWEYLLGQVKQKPSYTIPIQALGVLENSNSWDCRFLLSRLKILGFLPVDQGQKDSGSSMSTKKL